jgi:hypothetical protein
MVRIVAGVRGCCLGVWVYMSRPATGVRRESAFHGRLNWRKQSLQPGPKFDVQGLPRTRQVNRSVLLFDVPLLYENPLVFLKNIVIDAYCPLKLASRSWLLIQGVQKPCYNIQVGSTFDAQIYTSGNSWVQALRSCTIRLYSPMTIAVIIPTKRKPQVVT